jgi:hypothetical protein
MAFLTCGDVIDGVQATQLNDVEKVTWDDEILLSALNQALAILIGVRPDASAMAAEFSCVSGTRQKLPENGLRLLKVVRNIKYRYESEENFAGRAVRLVNMNDLDSIAPDWHSEPEKDTIKEYMFDERNPKTFYVYPPAIYGTLLDIEYSFMPEPITHREELLPVDITYQQTLHEFMLYKLLSGEGGQGQGAQHLNTGLSLIGAKPATEKYLKPINESNDGTGV